MRGQFIFFALLCIFKMSAQIPEKAYAKFDFIPEKRFYLKITFSVKHQMKFLPTGKLQVEE